MNLNIEIRGTKNSDFPTTPSAIYAQLIADEVAISDILPEDLTKFTKLFYVHGAVIDSVWKTDPFYKEI